MVWVTERRHEGLHRRPERSATALVVVFVTLGVAVVAGVALSTGAAARDAGSEEAARSFQRLAVVSAGSVVAPLLTPQLLDGSRSAAGTLGRAVDRLHRSGLVGTVTVRDGEGRVVWTDDAGAVAEPLRSEGLRAFRQRAAVLDPGTVQGSDADPVRAWVGVLDTAGAPLLVELTGPRAGTAAAARSVWTSAAPVTLGAVLLLQLLQLPVVLLLAWRMRRYQQATVALREAAGAATTLERRRIAREVHDDVLPELHGLVWELDTARIAQAQHDWVGQHGAAGLLERTADGVRSAIRRLRALLMDLSQARLPEDGLAAALADMAGQLAATGVRVDVHAPDLERLPRPAAQVLYRCAHEALRNVAAHSGAEQVDIDVSVAATDATMTVDDDGRGFDGSRLTARRADGHLGLQAIGDLIADAGGSLTASSSPGQGTRLVVRVPLQSVGVDMRVQP